MLVDPTQSSHAKTLASTQLASRATANASLFSTALANASTKKTASLKADSSSSDSAASTDKTSAKAPKGEKTEAVSGHSYSEIIAGPRNGMFLNTSGNARDGQAFARVRRDGREFHIYGSGKHRVIVEIKHPDKDTSNNTTTDNSNSSTSGSSTTSDTGTSSSGTDTSGTPSG
jgi:hypothetical protein